MPTRLPLAAFVIPLLASPALADVRLADLFTDNAVLQRDAAVPIYGTADAGEAVVIEFDGQSLTATAGEDGNWRVDLQPLKAGGPHELVVRGDDNAITLTNLLVGDVWLCGGQSNMAWTVQNSNDADREIAAANYPEIRLFHVPRNVADEPASGVDAVWRETAPDSIGSFSAVAYYFAREVQRETGVPIGLISSSWGGTGVESWTSRTALRDGRFDNLLEMDTSEFQPQHVPTTLYNGMIAPLRPYALRGFLWYQGERNTGDSAPYGKLLRGMIAQWRSDFDGPDAQPFYIVQLANFRQRSDDPATDDGWARLRAQQDAVSRDPNNGLATAIDIGEAGDIHPRNKQEVGRRLALLALRDVYGKDVVATGPTATSATADGAGVTVRFDSADGLTLTGNADQAFAVGDANGNFVWATPSVDGDTVRLTVTDLPGEPAAVRYAWQINPPTPLFNGAGLPASPFELMIEK